VKSWQRTTGLVLLVVAAVVIYQSLYVLRVFDHGQPGSGFMPFALGVVLAVLAILLILAHLGADGARTPFWAPGGWLRPLLGLLAIAGFAAVFDWLGAVVSVVLLVTAWLLVLERKSVVVAVFTGAATGGVVYLVFEVALQAPFPRGVLFGG
jgi:hypothetical protein